MGRNRMCGLWAVSCKSVLRGGEGSGQPSLCGVGESNPDEEVLLCFAWWLCSGLQKAGGGERVARSCPALLWTGCCSHPGMLFGGCMSGNCKGQALSCCAQLWFKAGSTAL